MEAQSAKLNVESEESNQMHILTVLKLATSADALLDDSEMAAHRIAIYSLIFWQKRTANRSQEVVINAHEK